MVEEPLEYGQVQSDNRQNWNDDGAENEKEDIADEISLCSFPSYVTLVVTGAVLVSDQSYCEKGERGQ